MTALGAPVMETHLPPPLCLSGFESIDQTINDNDVMMEEDTPEITTSLTTARFKANRTVSPLPPPKACEADDSIENLLKPCNSFDFDRWQKEHDWDEVVLMVGPHEEDEHIEDVLMEFTDSDKDTEYRMSLLDNAMVVVPSSSVPSIDEFLVDHRSDQAEIEIANLRGKKDPCLVPPTTTSSEPTIAAYTNIKERARGPKKKSKKSFPFPPLIPVRHPFEDQYTKHLCRLRESMQRSRQSRSSLFVTSPQIDRYPRRKSVSQVLHSIESSSHQIDNCYLDPTYLLQR